MKYLICIALFFATSGNIYSQPGFGFTYTHSEFEEEEGDERNVYTVEFVFKKSPADIAGLKAGDKIEKFHDAIVVFTNPIAMANRVKATPPTIQLIISRNGIEKQFTLTKADRSTYLNICLQGNCSDGNGTFVDSLGATYTGSFKKKKKEGSGKWSTPSGDSYQGHWKNDKREGYGVYTHKSDPTKIFAKGWSYSGDWKNDSMTGKGTITYDRGDIYSGEMLQNSRNGKGKMVLSNKTVYDGVWRAGKFHGKGTITLPNGDKRSGIFVDDLLDGQVLFYDKASNTTTTRLYKKGVPQ